jgi:hypothetical protein
VLDVATSADGLLVCTIGADQFIKVFDVINFGVLPGPAPKAQRHMGLGMCAQPVCSCCR